jgi:uncharacterized alpha-E superfamily protein
MGIISLEQTNRLYWLGRYTERVYTTIRLYSKCYDAMIDSIDENYEDFCQKLEIPNIYSDREDFNARYPYDETDTNSIYSNLVRAHDNAIVMREELGSDTLSYIQLAIYAMNKAKVSDAPLLELQGVEDNILAFWGISDDFINNDIIRNIIKTGKRVERIDLYARLKIGRENLKREFDKLSSRLEKSEMKYDVEMYKRLCELIDGEGETDYKGIVYAIDSLIEG